MEKIVILGNGIAGITAARHIRKRSDHEILVISGETEHFFSRTALMFIYMGHMKYENTKPYEDWFWKKNRIQLKQTWIEKVDFEKKQLIPTSGEPISYDKLILATGSASNKFGWKGQDLQGVQGLYSYQDLELMEANTSDVSMAVVLGGGLIGIEMAEMLHSRGIPVTYIIREKHFWDIVLPRENAQMIDEHLAKNHIKLLTETELEEILDDGNGRVKGIKTKSGETIDCQFVGLTVGVHPNVGFLKDSDLEIDRGILVDQYLKTNIDDVYAVGDCVQLKQPLDHRRPIEAVWYAGRMMGETVAQTLTGNPTSYKPGIWFNSAKFFDIEYQTYGLVAGQLREEESYFYWQHESEEKSIYITFHKDTKTAIGVNLFGIRQRHEVWDKWLSAGKTLGYVMEHLAEANFDPEFFSRYESDIQNTYNKQFPDQPVVLRKKGFLKKIFG
ncbi:MAG: FAD-dependent oxidoreductase [Cyclobacteriaceae bacterium]